LITESKKVFFIQEKILKSFKGLTQANSANLVSRRYLCVKNNDLLSKPGFFA
jgi:hypothetical protein